MSTNNLVEKVEVKKRKKKFFKILLFLILIGIISLGVYLFKENKKINEKSIYNSEMSNVFALAEYDNISENFKVAIFGLFKDNKFLEDNSQFFTKIPSRAKKVIAYGNFSNKKEYNGADATAEENYINDDIAFILEKNDFKSSVLYIMSENGSLLYYREFDDELPTISSFKKGAKIFINDRILEKSPSDGILIFTKNSKNVLLFNPKQNVFEIYYQYTNEDLEYDENEVDDYEYEDANDSIVNEAKSNLNDTIKQ